MKRAAKAATEGENPGLPGASVPEKPAANGSSGDQGTPSLVGKRTVYVDRQVARRARSRSKTKRIRSLKLLVALLIVLLLFACMGWILAWTKKEKLESDNLALNSRLRHVSEDLTKAQDTLKQRDHEIMNLVESRIPGLEPLQFDELLQINDRYLVNITFSESGTSRDRSIEYRTLLRNESNSMLLPDVKIQLFNEHGLQTGSSKLEKHNATSPVDLAELLPGETRSYHANLEIEPGTVPAYFKINVK